ncbi:hypothetical protein [Corynebacterium nasicanis]|uniref:Serine/threonine protein kinase n=1 Tax=Corynebacterium nasicanis TaxID=1448267 RepID=A0ABW1QB45_9CORY
MNRQDPETSVFPAQEYRRPRERSGLALVLLALLLLGTVVLGVWIYHTFLRADEAPVTPPPPPQTTVVTVTPTPSTPPPTTTVTSTTQTTPTTSTTEPPTFRAPDYAVQCAANVTWRIFRATDQTSCGFAENVAVAMRPHAGSTTAHELTVHSPVTGQNYRMTCVPEGDSSFTCRGGDNAVVVLEAREIRD